MTLRIEVGTQSDRGQVRTKNEDSYLTWRATESTAQIQMVLAVADGMGGHPGGDVASRLAVEGLEKILSSCTDFSPGKASEVLTSTFQEVHRVIRKGMEADPKLYGMGTTLTALVVTQDRLSAAHVGDSRLYEINPETADADVVCLTEDHTLAYEQMESGLIEIKDLESHPLSHVLTRSIGAGDVAAVDHLDLGFAADSERTFLLCSDGLIRVVNQNEFAGIVKEKPLQEAAEALVTLANERGAPDNVTVILVKIGTDAAPQKE